MQIKINYKDNSIAVYDHEDSRDYVELLAAIFKQVEEPNIRSVSFITDKFTVMYDDLDTYTSPKDGEFVTFNKLLLIPNDEEAITLVL